jgi:hypothetical protein
MRAQRTSRRALTASAATATRPKIMTQAPPGPDRSPSGPQWWTVYTDVADRCRAALSADADVPGGVTPWEQTRLGALVRAADAGERAAIALWTHDALAARHRAWAQRHAATRVNAEHSQLMAAASALAGAGFRWPAAVLESALHGTRDVLGPRPLGLPDLLDLPLAAAERDPAVVGDDAAGVLRWFAVRTDLRYTAWQAPRMRRRIERLLPPAAGSPDPHRLLTDGCPLAGRLRAALAPWLARPDIAALLRACESRPAAPAHAPAWRAGLAGLATADPAPVVLNVIGQTALAHRPARYRVWRRGRLVTRMIWAEPPTMLLLYGVLPALAAIPEPWPDPLLGALAANTIAVHPARRGRRPLMLRAAADALRMRATPDAARQLRRITGDHDLARLLRAACLCADPERCPHAFRAPAFRPAGVVT